MGTTRELEMGMKTQGGPPRMPTAQSYSPAGSDLEHTLNRSCYWAWVNRPFTPWFQANILDEPNEHPLRAQMGLMIFLE
jgi:hypothetical protein